MTATLTGQRHFYLEVMTACIFQVWIRKIASVADHITQNSPFVILSTHAGILEGLKQVAFGSGSVDFTFHNEKDKKDSKHAKRDSQVAAGKVFDG